MKQIGGHFGCFLSAPEHISLTIVVHEGTTIDVGGYHGVLFFASEDFRTVGKVERAVGFIPYGDVGSAFGGEIEIIFAIFEKDATGSPVTVFRPVDAGKRDAFETPVDEVLGFPYNRVAGDAEVGLEVTDVTGGVEIESVAKLDDGWVSKVIRNQRVVVGFLGLGDEGSS
jgi:hypothetical protein